MNKIWEYYKLSDVCSIHGRIGWQGLTRKEHKTSGDYLLITGTDFTEDNKINLKTCVYVDEYRYTQDENIQIRKDDLLITKDGTLGKLALISEELPKPATLNGGIFVLRDKTKKLYPRFLLNYMKSDEFRKIIHNNRTGSTVPHLTQNMLVNFPIPIPPLEEQKRIVAVLDKKFAQIETLKTAAEKNLQNTKQLFQAELEKAFSNSDFDRCLLGDIITVLTDFNANGGYAKLDSNIKMYDEPNYAVMVRTTDLERNDFNHGVKYVDKNAYDMLSKSTLFGNEIIMNKIGSAGKIYLMPCLNRPATLARNAFLIRLKETVDVRFIFLYLSSPEGTAAIMKHVHGAVTKTITKDEVRSIIVPLPPLEEQKSIVAHLDSLSEKVHQLKEIYTKQLADCDELKQSLLQKAFEGEL